MLQLFSSIFEHTAVKGHGTPLSITLPLEEFQKGELFRRIIP